MYSASMDDDSFTNHPTIRRANSASSTKIQNLIPLKQTIKGHVYILRALKPSESSESIKARIWTIFEKNMKSIYETTNVFHWDPPEKRLQMFHEHSRFLLITPDSRAETAKVPDGEDIIAYSIFRFERDEGRNAVYVYELQAADAARRLGLGRALIHNMDAIGRGFGMTTVMLTHLTVNKAAKTFYDSLGFKVDETSPDYEDESIHEGSEKNLELEEGYSILSRPINAD